MRIPASALLACLTSAAWAQGAPPGAMSCTGCHGLGPEAELSIEALSAEEIATAMAAYRDGTREATVMDRIARGFTGAETEAIARWIVERE